MDSLFADDLEFFFAGLDAQEVIVTLPDGSTRSFLGYLDAPFALHELGDGFALETAAHKLTCKASDAAGIMRGESTITVVGTEYDVTDVKPDGAGVTVIDLTKADAIVEVMS
ncbi:head-tail joining protein [Desulfovibrio ferrophilus]|uniref:Uncharacterized protein n=1 Tax=Desulfovibrio ferrophilus TaxID=241368 RepID=A0A2Z6AZ52_9BACT|nr:hypothetical protein [Desulfovibrio ferrophilus]BBD08455.1 uncharacterized protein DFE_1729 [Desulfovibrio ferrophilus]